MPRIDNRLVSDLPATSANAGVTASEAKSGVSTVTAKAISSAPAGHAVDGVSAIGSPAGGERTGRPAPASSAIRVAHGAAVVNTRALAGSWGATAATAVGGLSFSGLDLSDIDEATLRLNFPLRPGRLELPTRHDRAATEVAENATLEIVIHVTRDAAGEQQVQSARLTFRPPLKIDNPSHSLQPTGGALGGLFDAAKDLFGHVTVDGVSVNAQGVVELDGVVHQPFPLRDVPLAKRVAPGTLPRLHTALRRLSEGEIVAEAARPEAGQNPSLAALIAGLGAMTEEGDFGIDMRADKAALCVSGAGLTLSGADAPFVVNVAGTVTVDEHGLMRFRVPESPQPEIRSGAGDADLRGTLSLRLSHGKSLVGGGVIHTSFRPNMVSGEFRPAGGVEVPLRIEGAGNLVLGKTHIALSGQDVSVRKGTAKATLRMAADGARLDLDGQRLVIEHGTMTCDSALVFRVKENGLAIHDGTAEILLAGQDPELSLAGAPFTVDGSAEVLLRTDRVTLDPGAAGIASTGTLRLAVRPLGAQDACTLAEVPYRLNPDGTLRLVPGGAIPGELLTGTLALRGDPARIVDPRGPAAGPIGSAQFRSRLQQLTGAPIRGGNDVKLLVDGAMSHPERLRLLRSAQRSICLQTLIFKDDETGNQTVDELIAAAGRGVDVRVIVDAIGNVDQLKDLTKGKPLYERLTSAGVKLQLYNDPRAASFATALAELLAAPEFEQLGTPAAVLSNPALSLELAQRMARISLGRTPASAGTRATVERALAGAASEPAPSVRSDLLAQAVNGDRASLQEMLITLREAASLNFRWHEKYLIADGEAAITGGMNIADEYLLGGTSRKYRHGAEEREAWRDTDVLVAGPAVQDMQHAFTRNWASLTGEPPPPRPPSTTTPATGGCEVQFIRHEPRLDGDYHITNLMIEAVKALESGERAWFVNAYVLPTGALASLKRALIDAAARGVDVRIATNSEATTDLPQLNRVALREYQDLLAAGVRIYERVDGRTLHTKVATFAGKMAVVGSWNMDNRSTALNSEGVVVFYDKGVAREVEGLALDDMAPGVAHELTLQEIASRVNRAGPGDDLMALFADLM